MSLTIYAYIRFRKLRYWYLFLALNTPVLVAYLYDSGSSTPNGGLG